MNQRSLLQSNTELKFDSDHGAVSYVIESVLGIGSLCVLYRAYYLDNLGLKKYVKIKEYNPAQLYLERWTDLSIRAPEEEQEYFLKMRDRVVHSYLVSHELIQEEHVSNTISNAENIYEAYGTVYIIYSYMEGMDLAHYAVNSLEEAIRFTKSVAAAIYKIHKAGYLYLDIKPENILILDGTADLIQLFDFDSLVSINEIKKFTKNSITYSKGFSPVEQRLGDWNKIGKHSDVYSIGALFYYLIYGIPPKASDCNRRQPYSFEKSKYDFYDFPDSLGRKISEILQGTLQSYIKDRYSDLDPLIHKLSQIERLANPSLEYVLTQIPSNKMHLIGREEELGEIKRWMESDDPVLFITGMGGIGKSSVVTFALDHYRDVFDSVSYMRFHGSLAETLADDRNLCLHHLEKDPAEDISEYVQRKLFHLKRVCHENRILLVIDNYEEALSEELINLFEIGCKVIVVTRQLETMRYPVLNIHQIHEYEKQRELFLYNLGSQSLSSEDEENLSKMIMLLSGHTLSIELLAKQIRASFLTIREALELIREKGLANVGTETVLYEKDGCVSYETVYRIISSLYRLESVSIKQRNLLRMLSFSDIRGIDIRLFAELNGLESKEEINKLIRTGWISMHDTNIYLHPLLREVTRNAKWEETEILTLKKLALVMQEKIETLSAAWDGKNEAVGRCLDYARNVLSCNDLKQIIGKEQYENLWCCVAANLQRDDEEYILNCARNIDSSLVQSGRTMLKLWDISVRMLCESRNYAEADKMISEVNEYLQQRNGSDYDWAFYYGNIEEEYYDALMYDPDLQDLQNQYIDYLLEINENAIYYAFSSQDQDAGALRARLVVDRANFLIRMQIEEREDIQLLLEGGEKLVQDISKREPEIEIAFHLAHMWFYTIYDKNYEKAVTAWNRARIIGNEIKYPDLEKIDSLIVPGAEIEVDFGHYDASIELLNAGIKICETHQDAVPYVRKKEELQDHIQDVISIQEL